MPSKVDVCTGLGTGGEIAHVPQTVRHWLVLGLSELTSGQCRMAEIAAVYVRIDVLPRIRAGISRNPLSGKGIESVAHINDSLVHERNLRDLKRKLQEIFFVVDVRHSH